VLVRVYVLRVIRRAFVAVVVFAGGVAPSACATTTTKLESASAAPTYRIECIRLGDCWAEAHRACGGDYRMLERHDNTIPESDLPGLNERTDAHSYQRWSLDWPAARNPRPYGTGIESDQPMPLTDVVVVCSALR